MRYEDAARVKEICESAFDHVSELSLIQRRIEELSQNQFYYLAVYVDERDYTVKGFIQAETYDLLYREPGWNVMALAIAPESQGNGYSKELLTSLEHYAKDNGAAYIRLNSRIERLGAHEFNEQMGYTITKTQKHFIKPLYE